MINWYSKRFPFPRKGLKYFLRLLKISGNANRSFTRKLPNGLYIVVSPFEHIQQQLFWYGWYEKEYVRTWEALVQKGSTVIDIGANIGYYSLVAAKKGAKVLAFEPAPEHFSQLKKNIALNNLEQVHCFQKVVSDSNGLVPLYYSHSYNTGMTGLSQPEEFSGKKEMVPSVILDEVLQELGITQAGFIKIDIEGAELLALKGMGRIL